MLSQPWVRSSKFVAIASSLLGASASTTHASAISAKGVRTNAHGECSMTLSYKNPNMMTRSGLYKNMWISIMSPPRMSTWKKRYQTWMSKMSWTVCATFQHLEWLATFWFSHVCALAFWVTAILLLSLHRMPGAARHLGPYVMPRAQHDEHHVLCGDPKIEHVSKLRNSGQKPEHWSHPVSGWWGGGANCLHNILVVGLCSWPWAESCWDCLPFRPQGHTFRWADRSRSEVPLGQFHAPGRGTCVCSFLFLYKALDQLLHRWARCCLPSLFFAWVWLAADAWQLILACQFWMMIWKLAMGSKKKGKQVLPHLTHLPMLFMSCHALTHVRWHSMHVGPCHAMHTEVKHLPWPFL